MFSKCPGYYNAIQTRPEEIICPVCGTDNEIWSDEMKVKCYNCGAECSKAKAPVCADWCGFAGTCFPGWKQRGN